MEGVEYVGIDCQVCSRVLRLACLNESLIMLGKIKFVLLSGNLYELF
jgi:hypothetical protein